METAIITIVAEWAGSAFISILVDKAYSYLAERMLPADTESHLHSLKANLPKIEAVMGVAEDLKFKSRNSGVDKWLEQFKEAFFAAEDMFDEIKYRELEDEVNNEDQVSGFFYTIVDWLMRKISCHGCCPRACRGSTISEDTLSRLCEAVKKLDQVAKGVDPFIQIAKDLDVQPISTSNRETTTISNKREVFGRENEKAMIIKWLKNPVSHGNISAFCIIGVSGLGKTTLAQLIFEKISRENRFDKTIWVCVGVSTNFSVEDIIRKILQELGKKIDNIQSLNSLQKSLKEIIHSKFFFLILDNVWNDNKMCDWEKLIDPLTFVQQGSKILLTTRMKSVADMFSRVVDVERENLVLKGLEEQQLLKLLNMYAFSGFNPDNHKYLKKIGNDIVKKLRGSPLAARVIGSLLNLYMCTGEFDHSHSGSVIYFWKKNLNHDSLINLEEDKEVADVLKLSYYHLPAH